MKKKRLLITLVCLLLPIALRTLWFHNGIYFGNSSIQTPDYETLSITQPTLSTAVPLTFTSSEVKKVVLFDQAHENQYTMTEIESLRNLLLSIDTDIISLNSSTDLSIQLTKADAFVIITPTTPYTENEIEVIEEFVARGGRLLVAADPTRSYSDYDVDRQESVMRANEILQPFLLSFRNDYAYNLSHNEGNYRNIFVYPSKESNLTESVAEVVVYSSHSLDINKNSILTGKENTLSSLDDSSSQVPVAELDSSGNVLALGDMTFMTSPYDHVADNYQFIHNIANYLVGGERDKSLYDFPNLFNQPITIQFSSGITLDENLLTSISKIKKAFSQDDLEVVLLDQVEDGYDRILLGTYPPSDELAEEIAELGLSFTGEIPAVTRTQPAALADEAAESAEINEAPLSYSNGYSDYFYVPGIGSVPSYGFGYVLLKTEDNSNSLILLGDNQENTAALLQLVVLGTLDDCLVTDTIAVCEQSVIANYSITEDMYTDYSDSSTDYETLDSEATAQPDFPYSATATASG